MAYISKSRKVAYPFMTLFLENRNGSTTWYGIETNLSSAEKIGARMERFDHGTPLKSREAYAARDRLMSRWRSTYATTPHNRKAASSSR
jgi:hypothetical protein